jgi:hypothetical protein
MSAIRAKRRAKTAHPIEPVLVSISEASRLSGGISRAKVCRDLAAGRLRGVKCGARTMILMESLREHWASLPAATFKAPNGTN